MTAAGLISFYDEYEGGLRLSPTAIVLISVVFSVIVIVAHLIG